MLENRYVWKNMDTFLKQTLVILLAYKGPSSFEVGIKIGELTLKFEDKYKVLYDIFEGNVDNCYSTIIKRIAFELVVGVPVQIT
jgi:hypothetical protein